MELEEVTEGATALRVPAGRGAPARGPASAGPGFYNPAMALTRDLTVLAARAQRPPRGATFLDGLAAAGARGLRVAHEAPGWEVELNDHDARACELARDNARALGLAVSVHHRDLHALVAGRAWWFLEVDPYGSPVPFLASATRSVRPGGILALSATDTTALHGVKPSVTRRRYLAEPPPKGAPGWKAAAARLLVGHVVRVAAQFDLAAEPLFVHEHQHAFRAYLRVRKGAGRADAALETLDEQVLCSACQTWGPEACACGEGSPSGPYWMGPLHQEGFLAGLLEARDGATLAADKAVERLLETARAEASMGPFYLDVPAVCSALGGLDPPGRRGLLEGLREAGLPAARSIFSPEAVAYHGQPEEAMEVLRSLSEGA